MPKWNVLFLVEIREAPIDAMRKKEAFGLFARLGGSNAVEQMALPGLTTVRRLGAGAFGEVFSARENKTGSMLVVKRLLKSKVPYEMVVREASILQYLEPLCRPYILCYRAFTQDSQYYYLQTEFLADFVPLDELIAAGSLDDTEKASIVRKLIAGLAIVHSHDVVHLDIKPPNVMVTRNGQQVKYIDFGLSCMRAGCAKRFWGGTPGFMSPELYLGSPSLWSIAELKRIDIWALGITIWQVVVGQATTTIWRQASEAWYRAFKPQTLVTINALRPAARWQKWVYMFVRNFNYLNPRDQINAANKRVEVFLAANNLPSLRVMLNRNPLQRTLSVVKVPFVGGRSSSSSSSSRMCGFPSPLTAGGCAPCIAKARRRAAELGLYANLLN
jgi:serine/threonine protein kinase